MSLTFSHRYLLLRALQIVFLDETFNHKLITKYIYIEHGDTEAYCCNVNYFINSKFWLINSKFQINNSFRLSNPKFLLTNSKFRINNSKFRLSNSKFRDANPKFWLNNLIISFRFASFGGLRPRVYIQIMHFYCIGFIVPFNIFQVI